MYGLSVFYPPRIIWMKYLSSFTLPENLTTKASHRWIFAFLPPNPPSFQSSSPSNNQMAKLRDARKKFSVKLQGCKEKPHLISNYAAVLHLLKGLKNTSFGDPFRVAKDHQVTPFFQTKKQTSKIRFARVLHIVRKSCEKRLLVLFGLISLSKSKKSLGGNTDLNIFFLGCPMKSQKRRRSSKKSWEKQRLCKINFGVPLGVGNKTFHGFERHGAAGNVRGQIGDDFLGIFAASPTRWQFIRGYNG